MNDIFLFITWEIFFLKLLFFSLNIAYFVMFAIYSLDKRLKVFNSGGVFKEIKECTLI